MEPFRKKGKKSTRLSDCEDALDKCAKALQLIPVWAMRRGQTWMPSEEALDLIADAKDSLAKFAERHPVNGNGNHS